MKNERDERPLNFQSIILERCMDPQLLGWIRRGMFRWSADRLTCDSGDCAEEWRETGS
jgi:hypothetical protein